MAGYNGDGIAATGAKINSPAGLAVDSHGNLFIADTDNFRIREVSNGAIFTVAGDGDFGYSGDTGPATSAKLDQPTDVKVDNQGNLYIADTGNDSVREVSSGTIATIAGNGMQGYSGDNDAATSAELCDPSGLALDAAGNLYISDSCNNAIRMVDRTGTIQTIAGPGPGYSGDDGPATNAALFQPEGLAVDSAGNIYIADSFNSVLRLLTPAGAAPLLTVTSAHSGNFGPGATGQYSVNVSNVDGAGATTGPVTVTEIPPGGLTITGLTGTDWNCSLATNTCTRNESLSAGASYPAITVSLNVAGTAPPQVTNQVTVAGGGAMMAGAEDLTLISYPPLSITGPAALPAATLDAAFSPVTITTTGGSGSNTWTATGLPAGVTIDASTGVVSGTPTVDSSSPYAVQVAVTDSNLDTGTKSYLLTVGALSPCDVNRDGKVDILDVQLMIREALGIAMPNHDLSSDSVVNAVDNQIVTNAVLGFGCFGS